MKLEVGQAQDGTWYYRCRVNGRIMAHGADYNSKGGATRAVVNHVLACHKYIQTFWWPVTVPSAKEYLIFRQYVRKQINYV